jgi:hypothetical protein
VPNLSRGSGGEHPSRPASDPPVRAATKIAPRQRAVGRGGVGEERKRLEKSGNWKRNSNAKGNRGRSEPAPPRPTDRED